MFNNDQNYFNKKKFVVKKFIAVVSVGTIK